VNFKSSSGTPCQRCRQNQPIFWENSTLNRLKKFAANQADFLTYLPYSRASSRLVDCAIALREGGQL
jgi:hypothetical protein